MAAGGSCRIDFYLLGADTLDSRKLACKLALMAWERGHDIAVVTDSPAAAAALDELMWEYPEGRYLPHEHCEEASDSPAPVRIIQAMPEHPGDVVINLTGQPVPEPHRFRRLLEIVPHRPEERRSSRRKYRAYRALGIEPATHEIN